MDPFLFPAFFCYHEAMIELFGTLGPACSDTDTLTEMFQAGMSGMRLNLSHASLSESEAMIRCFQTAAERASVKPELLIDLQGPELRIGTLPQPLELHEADRIPLAALHLPEAVTDALCEQDGILMDDGRLEGTVTGGDLKILRGGTLTSRKSIKIIGRDVPMPALTETDRQNLSAALHFGVSAVMQPFTRSAEDVREVRDALNACGAESVRIFSKIENRQGLSHLEEIIRCSDMVVIARGDLGNDLPLYELPGVQKDIAACCLKEKVPFLVVTQMLISMIHSPIPTRAEVSDIFNAVTDGASAIMVTNETAVGEYPVNVIRVMHDTVAAAEHWLTNH